MPYFKKPEQVEVDTLSMPSNPAYWVKLKRRGLYSDEEAASKALTASMRPAIAGMVGGRNGSSEAQRRAQLVDTASEVDMSIHTRTRMCRLIVEWNLDFGGGEIAPINDAFISKLDAEDGKFLEAECQVRMGTRSPEEQANFPKQSAPPSTATATSKTKRR